MRILKFLIIFLFLLNINLDCFSQYDFRKTTWGMSKEEVKKSEKSYYFEDEDNRLTYHNIQLDNGLIGEVQYNFTNNKLDFVYYTIWGEKIDPKTNRYYSFEKKVQNSQFIFDILRSKGYNCDYHGWAMQLGRVANDYEHKKISSCNTDPETIKIVAKLFDKYIKEDYLNDYTLSLYLTNGRTDLRIRFDEFYYYTNDVDSFEYLREECYKGKAELITISYYPSKQTKNKMNSDQF